MRARRITRCITARHRSRWHRSIASACGLVVSGLLLPVGAPIAATGSATDDAAAPFAPAASLPPATAGMCFAKVSVPESWDVEPLEIERRAEDVHFVITPARFGQRKRRVVVREAETELRAVQPVLETETQSRPLAPPTTRWVRGGLGGELPIAAGDRLDLIAAGIELEAVAPGTCYVEHFRPARIRTTAERVLVREASEQLAVMGAVFETVRRSIVTRSAHSRLIEVPAVWEEGTRRVETQASSVAWTPGHGPIQRLDHMTGEILCRVDVPAVFETLSQVTIAQPATVTRVHEPALRESVEVQRLVSDAIGTREPESAVWGTVEIPHVEEPGAYVWHVERAVDANAEPLIAAARPALAPDATDSPTGRSLCHREVPATAVEYERLVVREQGRFERETRPAEHVVHDVQALLDDARSARVDVPAVVETVERRVQASEASVEWRPVLCETNLTHPVIVRLQKALAREGFSPGAIDGRLGRGTLGAVTRYQKANDLATGGLTIETVEALEVEL